MWTLNFGASRGPLRLRFPFYVIVKLRVPGITHTNDVTQKGALREENDENSTFCFVKWNAIKALFARANEESPRQTGVRK